ncbi:hypothetical protein [Modestobacter sp. NPDC049651]|uniref:hypothetical protein n=1 Tax=unclassified Modestobacter TaxID=2643866 RepID=UPI0033D47E09
MIVLAATATGTPFGAAPLPAAVVPGCRADVTGVRMAAFGAPLQGTGLPVAGLGAAVRLRGLGGYATAPTGTGWTGLTGTDSTEPTTEPMTGTAFGAPAHRTTPGDLPPEDPLS